MPEPFTDVLVTRPELEALVRPSLLRSVEMLSATITASGVHPLALAGIYLVGGSSRMPVVATLIGERLRVVPASLDQPETAVALGAHHVPRNGVTIRPREQQPAPQQYPTTGEFMASAHFPQLAPTPAPVRKGVPKAALVSVGAVVLVILLAVAGFLVVGQNQLPSAADCAQPGTPDDKGFTSCTRQLAGPVADQGDCHGGYDGTGVAVPGLTGSQVTCHLDGQTIVYTQANSLDEVKNKAKALIDAYPTSAKVQAGWQGNGLAGSYQALVASGVGVVVFTVADRPLVGVLTAPAASSPSVLTAAKAAGTFERSVQPGT
jgi:hypothetical protein